jgi:hypothetical protein
MTTKKPHRFPLISFSLIKLSGASGISREANGRDPHGSLVPGDGRPGPTDYFDDRSDWKITMLCWYNSNVERRVFMISSI